MKHALAAAALCLAVSTLSAAPSVILVRGRVFTGDDKHPWADAVAITGAVISAVGSDSEIRALATPQTRVIDVAGRLVIPGINDAHMHLQSGVTAFGVGNDLDADWKQLAAGISAATDETPADLWITAVMGRGLVNDTTITRQKLDALVPGRKVMLESFTGHGMVLSTAAMKALGVDEKAKDPLGGWYERDASGVLNGRVFEYAQMALDRKFADLASGEELGNALSGLSDEALSYGITTLQAMPATSEARVVQALADARVPVRVRVISYPSTAEGKPWMQKGGALKWILDGTPIERNAALRTAHYRAGGSGRENFADLTPLLAMAADNHQQILLHASGDKTIASALNALAKQQFDRPRIEHADGLQPDLFPLAKKTGVVAVLNPTHFRARDFFPSDGPYMLAKSLLKAGIPLAIGSDGPLNPFLNIQFAVARRDQPSESLTIEEALKAYTSGAAYAEMAETKKGIIAPGMLADLAVLSQDIFRVSSEVLPDTRSVLTMIDGKVVYEQMTP